jgi:hypothetical protein
MDTQVEKVYKRIYDEYVKTQTQTHDSNSDESTNVFDKDKYTKFFDLFNNVIIFFIMNTYETILHKIKNEDWNLEKVNNIINNNENLLLTLKIQLNIYWSEFNKKNNNKDQLITDLDDLIKVGIIRHRICLFKFIKSMCISIIGDINKIKLVDVNNFDEFIDKIAKISHAILEINKTSTFDDEDGFDCDGCEFVAKTDIFWS